MIEVSMYSISNFSPAEYLNGASDAVKTADAGAFFTGNAVSGMSFQEYLATLTSAAETYRERPAELNSDSARESSYGSGIPEHRSEFETDRNSAEGYSRSKTEEAAETNGQNTANTASAAGPADVSVNSTEGEARQDPRESNSDRGNGQDVLSPKHADETGDGQGTAEGESSALKNKTEHADAQNTALHAAGRKRGNLEDVKNQNQKQREVRENNREDDEESAGLQKVIRNPISLDKDSYLDNAACAAEFSPAGTGLKKAAETEKSSAVSGKDLSASDVRDGRTSLKPNKLQQDRPKITIVDRRDAAERFRNSPDGQQTQRRNSPQEFHLTSAKTGGVSSQGMPDQNSIPQHAMQVLVHSAGSEDLHLPITKGNTPSDIQNQLVKQLREQLNGEIVKRGSILMRNNGTGEIRLELKPENLGHVKIRLSLENNHIAGKILVENVNVKEAFDQNMQELYRSFREHGFQDTSLNVSVGNQHRQKNPHGEAGGAADSRSGSSIVQTVEAENVRFSQSNVENRLVDVLA